VVVVEFRAGKQLGVVDRRAGRAHGTVERAREWGLAGSRRFVYASLAVPDTCRGSP
jgi:hypothetical protein